jgi:thiol:disulfide interchange protein
MSFGDALDRARTEDRLVMVDVYTDWCGWCKKLDSETFGDLRVAEALKNVISIRVNAEKGGESVAARYGVRGFPTVLFLSASGDVVRKIEGYVDADEMLRIVSSLRKPA